MNWALSIFKKPWRIMKASMMNWAKAVGALSGVAGSINGIGVNLQSNFGFEAAQDEHSAQFNWTAQRLTRFYGRLLQELGIVP